MSAAVAAHVLYVEADPEARARITASLTGLGYLVACAHDGPSALESFGTRAPDVVLLGLRLVGMEAVEVCRRVKELAAGSFLPVIYLTPESEVAEKVRVLEAGGDDFCVEPTCVAELDARIRVLLRMRARERTLVLQSNRFRLIAYVDALTEIGNRRAFERTFEDAWRSRAEHDTLALLVTDIDWFKRVNDRHGHAAGDRVLQEVARAIQGAVRKHDEVFRFGGEEFAVVAPGVDRSGALSIAERVRASVAATAIALPPDGGGAVTVTVSVGIAIGPDDGASPQDLFLAADRSLYAAKQAGRNRVVAGEPPAPSPFRHEARRLTR